MIILLTDYVIGLAYAITHLSVHYYLLHTCIHTDFRRVIRTRLYCIHLSYLSLLAEAHDAARAPDLGRRGADHVLQPIRGRGCRGR